MEEKKLRLIKSGEQGINYEAIESSIAVNDVYIDSI